MTDPPIHGDKPQVPPRKRPPHRRESDNRSPLPGWVTATVVLGLLGLLGYNVIVIGPDGYPTSMLLGGLLGAYAGIDQLLKRRREDQDDQ